MNLKIYHFTAYLRSLGFQFGGIGLGLEEDMHFFKKKKKLLEHSNG